MACRRNAPLLPLLQPVSLPRMPVTLEESGVEHLPSHLLHKPKASRNGNPGLRKSSPYIVRRENRPKRERAVYLRLCCETAVKLWWAVVEGDSHSRIYLLHHRPCCNLFACVECGSSWSSVALNFYLPYMYSCRIAQQEEYSHAHSGPTCSAIALAPRLRRYRTSLREICIALAT